MTKVLLVDDEVDFLKIMKLRLESWGYTCVDVSSSMQALEIVRTDHPDIIVLDYMMPDMDGVELLQQIRILLPLIPVIMLTAYPHQEAMKEANT